MFKNTKFYIGRVPEALGYTLLIGLLYTSAYEGWLCGIGFLGFGVWFIKEYPELEDKILSKFVVEEDLNAVKLQLANEGCQILEVNPIHNKYVGDYEIVFIEPE